MPLSDAPSSAAEPASSLFAVDAPHPPPMLDREWLATDGRGGYAASTPTLCPTRRYHGLLVSSFPGADRRFVFLARFDERLAGEPLSVARYGGVWGPRGDRALASFEAAPHPTATYAAAGARLARSIRMAHGRRAVLVRYELAEADGPRELELRPLLPFRDAGALTVENDAADATTRRLAGDAGGFAWRLYDALPTLALTASRPLEAAGEPVWYRGLSFEADEARGYEGREDQLSPCALRVTLAPGEAVVLAATIEEPLGDPAALWDAAEERERKAARGRPADPVAARFDDAADDFLYRDDAGRLGVVAGYPWFGEWGRDTFIALPGLTLARGRRRECEDALLGALPYLKDGLLPNVFGAGPEDAAYDSADAALWFARAVLLLDRAGGARRTLKRELLPALESIYEAYVAGAPLGLRFDEDGILHAGSPELNPTWMDARVDGRPVTPRHGAPVEIAALGYSLLAHLDELADGPWSELRRRAKRAFVRRFWVEEGEYLADVCRPDGTRDEAVRPNMVLAAALELSPLSRRKRAAVVERARVELLTPRGLRTLAPGEPDYAGFYAGGPAERDGAYHQGTVWPWLLGFHVEAALRAARPTRKRRAELAALLDGLAPELDRVGLGHVSEVFDGDAPHEPGGTFAQAWNTAEWLRARRLLEGSGG